MKRVILSAAVNLMLLASFATAAVPPLVSFQGLLRDGSGNPVNDATYPLSVRIYSNASGTGLPLWSDNFMVATSDGVFSVNLGSGSPLPTALFSTANLWVGVSIAGEPEAIPRTQLTSVPFSARVGTVDGATGGDISGDVSIQGDPAVDGSMGTGFILIRNPGRPNGGGLTIEASPGQTAPLVELTDAGGTPVASIAPDGILATPAVQLGLSSTISNFPNPVPIEVKTGQGSMFIGRDDGTLQMLAPAPGGNVTKLTEWKNSSGETVGHIDPTGALFARYAIFAHATHCEESLRVDGDVVVGGHFQTSGIAEVTGNDIVVSLATLHTAPVGINTATVPDVALRAQSGALLHELGHNLSLTHTGPSNEDFVQAWDNTGHKVASIDAVGNVTIDGDMDGLNSQFESGHYIDLDCDGTFNNDGTSTFGGPIGVQTPPLPVFAIDAAGAVHATSFPVSSDVRLKENVKPLTDVLEKLQKVRGVSFDWNDTYKKLGRASGHREIGVIAQELEAVFPELVTHWSDQDYRAVEYGRLSAVLIEAVKEQQEQIDELRAEIAELREGAQQAALTK